MGVHHVAVATRDLDATHRFYTEAMGFRLAKVEANHTDTGGWARHVFYDAGDSMFAVWDLHDDALDGHGTAISTGLGLPPWVNHLAFDAPDQATLDAARDRWLAHGHDVVEVDHGWCRSVYTNDPNDILVEWCWSTRELTDEDAREAEALLAAEQPELGATPTPVFHLAAEHAAAAGT